MNQHLQSILNFIQQDESLAPDEKNALSKSLRDADKELELTALKLDRTEKVKRATAILLEDTIDELEQKTIAAEAQTRELEIETSLERVRTIAMGMTQPADMLDICRIISRELQALNVTNIRNIQTAIFYESRGIYLNYEYFSLHDKTVITEVEYNLQPDVKSFVNQMLQDPEAFFTTSFEGDSLQEWIEYQKIAQQFVDPLLQETKSLHYYFYSIGPGALGISTYAPLSEENIAVFKRFRNVFNLTYRRFMDIEKAEAQAREAMIEASLERVRGRTMAMHSSDDVSLAIATLFTELDRLGIENMRCGIAIINKNKTMEVWSVTNMDGGKTVKAAGTFNMDTHTVWKLFFNSWNSKSEFLHYYISGKEKQEYIDTLNNTPNYLSQPILEMPDMNFQSYHFNEGAIWTFSMQPHSEEHQHVMKRFTAVFSQTFRRYLDLQKAEAQAREAQIELGLERVRAKAMAMQKSDDLAHAVAIIFEELEKLSKGMLRCGIGIINKENRSVNVWAAAISDKNAPLQISGDESMDTHPLLQGAFNAWLKQEDYSYELEGEDLTSYYKAQAAANFKLPDSQSLTAIEGIRQYYFLSTFQAGGLFAFRETPFPEEARKVMKRFAGVLNLTYKRFDDLQKAEAQARESQIEAALERVRSKTMAMQHSDELREAANLLFHEVKGLGIHAWSCGYNIWDEDRKAATVWMSSEGTIQPPFKTPLTEYPTFIHFYEAAQRGESLFIEEMSGEVLKAHYNYMLTLPGLEGILDNVQKAGFSTPTFQINHAAFFSYGYLLFITYEPYPEAHDIFKRFAVVFEQTYIRFLDLQKAEAQAREAIKASSLDRIRAEIASMRTAGDLQRITPSVWKELTILGLPFFRCGIFILNEKEEKIHSYLSTPDGQPLAVLHLDFTSSEITRHIADYWRQQKVYTEHWNREQFMTWVQSLIGQRQIKAANIYQAGDEPPELLSLQFVPFIQGMLYVGSAEALSETQVELVKALADAFSVAYARYEDFTKLEEAKGQVEKALKELKATQSQLIQSEKMASLGELTAGIAHEIQNPLNFVNNFSEVSAEMMDEMEKEFVAGNREQGVALVSDIRQNLEKILHHGKRADAIVKGMLQHTRRSTGKKEPTDINALADEYLRLAYHGLRAKDKSFNATLKTNFDKSIGKINVIPQDIGRVILNLINNAFYAVAEKKKEQPEGFEPHVSVFTKKLEDKVSISVKDNGKGIPQQIADKIFQPFFTTKPAGQGTGLGLSLSYDIVKAHGGELKVETKEGEGSEFMITLYSSEVYFSDT